MGIHQIQSGEKMILGLPFGISCGLAGGSWNVISSMIEDIFIDSCVEVFIVELINKSFLHDRAVTRASY